MLVEAEGRAARFNAQSSLDGDRYRDFRALAREIAQRCNVAEP